MKHRERWYSSRFCRDVHLTRWGYFGDPVLLFPTAGGDAEECERFLMIQALQPLIDAGRIKVYSLDSVPGMALLFEDISNQEMTRLQNLYDAEISQEVVPRIRQDCHSDHIPIITAGASLGAFNAMMVLCRHPDSFRAAVCMSSNFDLSRILEGAFNLDLYYSTPLMFLPNHPENDHLRLLRKRYAIIALGSGPYENPQHSRNMARVLGRCGIPHRLDFWGADHGHDWPTWRAMLPQYLEQLTHETWTPATDALLREDAHLHGGDAVSMVF